MGPVPEELAKLLTDWYRKNARNLPWRGTGDPYRIWISEIMLQQTRIEAVKDYYERFTEAFPTLTALAEASEETVLKAWEGLGYYSRARNLHRTAKICEERFGGKLPESFAELLKLPGIGRYTAGAVASIAFGENVPAVDGNVLRVLCRVLGDSRNVLEPPMRTEAEECLREHPKEDPGGFNEAVMELGETVCLPGGKPLCGGCPLRDLCTACLEGRESELPVRLAKTGKKTEEWTVLRIVCRGRLALEQRPARGLLAGLWLLPMLPGKLTREELPAALAARFGKLPEGTEPVPLGEAKHVFTHRIWRMTGFGLECGEEWPGLTYISPGDTTHPLPAAARFYLPPEFAAGEKED